MRDVKRRVETYSCYDHSGISAHLEAMAAQGWLLEKRANALWTYRRAQPQQLTYAVAYYPEGSAFDPEPNEGLSEFYELCAHDGWEFVTAFAEMQIFVSRRENPPPLDTDPVVELDVIHRSSRRRFLKAYWVFLVICALFAFPGLGGLFADPVYALSGLYSVPAGLAFAFMAAACAAELICYYRWYSRARRAAEHGERMETSSPHRLISALLWCTYAALALCLLSVFTAGDSFIRFSFALVIVVYIIGSVVMRVSAGKLRRRSTPRTITLAVSLVLVFAVCFALYSAAGPAITRMAEDAYRGEQNYVNYSLALEDLTGRDTPGYVRVVSHRASMILAQSSVDEHFSAHTQEGGEDMGALEYTTTYVRLPDLYGFCERSLSRGLEPADPAPWGAERAYADSAQRSWLLCYGDRLVELSLPFQPSPAQSELIGERLGV